MKNKLTYRAKVRPPSGADAPVCVPRTRKRASVPDSACQPPAIGTPSQKLGRERCSGLKLSSPFDVGGETVENKLVHGGVACANSRIPRDWPCSL